MKQTIYQLLFLLIGMQTTYSQSNITISSAAGQLNSSSQNVHLIAGESVTHKGAANNTQIKAGFHYSIMNTSVNSANDFTFFSDDTVVQTGMNLSLPIRVKNCPTAGVGAFQEVIQFDNTKLNYNNFSSSLGADLTIIQNNDKLNIYYSNGLGLGSIWADSTVIVYLNFTILMGTGQHTNLNLATEPSSGAWDGNLAPIPYNSYFDTISVVNTVNISGNITTEIGIPMPYVAIDPSITTIQTDTTNLLGEYNIVATPGNNLTLTPARSQDIARANGIDVADIGLIRRHIYGITTFNSPYKYIAANVSQDAFINVLDILMIRQRIFGIINDFNGKQYEFIPSNHVFTNPTSPWVYPTFFNYPNTQAQINQNFTGVVLGDVNGTWNNTLRNTNQQVVTINIDSSNALQNDNSLIAFRAVGIQDVTAYQMTVVWDSTVALIDSVIMTNGLNIQFHQHTAGSLTILYNTTNGAAINIPDETVLFTLKYQAIGASGSSTPIEINSSIIPLVVYDNSFSPLTVQTNSGHLEITAPTSINNIANNINYIVQPNPFKDQLTFSFEKNTTQAINFKLVDVLGRVLVNKTKQYEVGHHEFTWNLKAYKLIPGNYFLVTTINDYQQTQQLIKQ